ncbi:MAG: SDR family oxidoreductase [Dehalococcoidia bacterium]|nr:SDR family oxidoreductase [Dehalococcoidia bacterium]
MDLGIRGRKAIVNGGSAGLGRGSALALAREGVDLVVSARGEERLQETCREIARETGVTVTPVVADHSSVEGRARILAACPNPDILVLTCSPPPVTGDFRAIEPQDWYDNLAVTLVSPVEFVRATVDGMVARGFGRIVNIGTGAAKFPTEIRILSGAPRAALNNYLVALAKKVARHNVVINNLLPGMHHTAGILEGFNERARVNGTSYDEEVTRFAKDWRIPAGGFGDAEDFGAFCALLCSQQARYVIGQSLVVDGGIGNATF